MPSTSRVDALRLFSPIPRRFARPLRALVPAVALFVSVLGVPAGAQPHDRGAGSHPAGGVHAPTSPEDAVQEAGGAHAAPADAQGAAGHGEDTHAGDAHGESWGAFLSRLANFAILAAGLWYFLRTPFGRYLQERSRSIREGLEHAAQLRSRASAQLSDIETRMRTLPGELEALRARGAEDIRGQEARLRRAAEEDRARLLDQTQREVDLQLQAARRDLRRDAAQLAVEVAARRVAAVMTDGDQRRLIGRYISQVQAAHE